MWSTESTPEWYNFDFTRLSIKEIEIITNDILFEHTFQTKDRGQEEGNLVCPGKRIHHAMIVIKRSIYIRYDERQHLERKEDGKLCKDILWSLGNVLFVNLPLMVYRP
jgi:hypothetical protein